VAGTDLPALDVACDPGRRGAHPHLGPRHPTRPAFVRSDRTGRARRPAGRSGSPR
jgi:hypothetical protein